MEKKYKDIPEPFLGFLMQGREPLAFDTESHYSDLMFLAAVLALCDE
ncbi:MAG: hypothetical protein FWB74_09665 [Defluviitaleaceae bacterium]|nr:hypothetical protein [Defluviitaleaceae bacterium]